MTEVLHDTPEQHTSAVQQGIGATVLAGPGEAGGGPTVVERNIRKLEQAGEVGAFFAPLYKHIIDAEPRLDAVLVQPFKKGDRIYEAGMPGIAFRGFESGSGSDEVHLNVESWKEYKKILRTRSGAAEVTAKKLGINLRRLSPQLFAMFTTAHEFGHQLEVIETQITPEADKVRLDAEMATLPVPGLAPSQLIEACKWHPNKARRYLKQHQERLAEIGVGSVRQLIAAQEKAYRALPSEDYADQFAVRMLSVTEA